MPTNTHAPHTTHTPGHTPGPWAVTKHASPDYAPQFGIYAEGSPRDLATVCGNNADSAKHDAALISAAPNLLAALQQAADQLDCTVRALALGHKVSVSSLQNCAAAARAALARAQS